MRLYGGRILKNRVNQQIISRQELRDAIVYDVTPASKYCRVKIQGSDTYIKAYYNENWGSTPEWLKPGNAVRISHPGGNKGRIEVMGHGILIPTAIPGGSVTPTATTPGDTILTGMAITATDPASMSLTVMTGTYRIAGVTYTLGALQMDQATIEMDRADMTMDGSSATVTLDAAHATYFRYDSIVVGADGVVDVVKGTAAVSDPVMPTTPADHIRIGWVLVYPAATTIAQSAVYQLYTDRQAVGITVVVADDDLAWAQTSTSITITVVDQYGRTLSGSYIATVAFSRGNGTLSQGGDSSTTSLTIAFSGSVSVTYTRNGIDPGDNSPTITVDESTTGYSGGCFIILRDASSGIMITG